MFEMDPAFGHCDPRQSAPPLLHALTSSNACMPHNPKHHTAVAVRLGHGWVKTYYLFCFWVSYSVRMGMAAIAE